MFTSVGDFLLSLKWRLRETKDTNWTDEGLLELVNLSLAKISRDLLLFKDTGEYEARADKTFYPLPKNKVNTISVSIDGKTILYKSFDWIMSNPQARSSQTLYAYETQEGMTFTQAPTKGKILIAYNSTRRVDSTLENLPLPDFAYESLMLYSLYLANQREASDKSFAKSQNFMGLYMQEVERLKAAIKKNYSSKNISSDWQRV